MRRLKQPAFPLLFGVCVVALEALFAYCIWSAAPVGTRWLGDTIQNSSDIAVYFSYLRQGEDGALLLANRYAVEPAALRFDPVWSTAGVIARTGIPLVLLHEFLIFAFTLVLVYAVYTAARELSDVRDARLGTILAFGGVGLGSLYSVWLQAFHLWTPKTYAAPDVVTEFAISPVLIGGAHMILSLALLITGLRLSWRAWRDQRLRDAIFATAAIGILSSFHPYFCITFIIFNAICVLRFKKRISRKIFFAGCGFSILAALPTIAIYLPLAFDRVFREHQLNANTLPLPHVLSWVFTLAPFVVALAWRWKHSLKRSIPKNEEWLIAWIVSALICMAFPFPWKRKYLEGLGVALVLLTLPVWLALRDWILKQRPKFLSRTIGVMLLFAACLTPLHLFASQLSWIAPDPDKQHWFYASDEIFAAWNWLRLHTVPQSIIVSDDMWVNVWTPAYADRTVWLGHDHETPEYWTKYALWKELMHSTDGKRAAEILDGTPVDLLLLTTTSTQADFPGWLAPEWHVAYQSTGVVILDRTRVP